MTPTKYESLSRPVRQKEVDSGRWAGQRRGEKIGKATGETYLNTLVRLKKRSVDKSLTANKRGKNLESDKQAWTCTRMNLRPGSNSELTIRV